MKKNITLSLLFGLVLPTAVWSSDAVGEAALVGDATAGAGKVEACVACHGVDGKGLNPEWPRLAGQNAAYTAKQLTEFKSGLRKDPVMAPQAANLSEQDILDIAAYYESMEKVFDFAGVTADEDVTDELLTRGENLYRGGDLARGITACTACHGPTGLGVAPSAYPMISGQYKEYISAQLKAFRLGALIDEQASTSNPAAMTYRDNDPGRMMRSIAVKLTDRDIEALSYYVQGLQP